MRSRLARFDAPAHGGYPTALGVAARSDELRQIEGCLVAPEERRPGRTYERVQELLGEVRALRGIPDVIGGP